MGVCLLLLLLLLLLLVVVACLLAGWQSNKLMLSILHHCCSPMGRFGFSQTHWHVERQAKKMEQIGWRRERESFGASSFECGHLLEASNVGLTRSLVCWKLIAIATIWSSFADLS